MSTCKTCGYKEASESTVFVTKKVGTRINLADVMTKPMPRPKIEQLMNIMGYEFVEVFEASRSAWYEINGKFDSNMRP